MITHHLTTPQSNIWNLQKYYPETAVSNICGVAFFQERRDSERLKQAIRMVIQKQTALRLRFREEETPVQYVSEETEEDFPVMEFSDMVAFDRFAEEFARTPLQMTESAMYRAVIIHLADRSGILLCLSHLVADAWTFGVLVKQLDDAYRGSEDREDILQPADYVQFIRTEGNYLVSERHQRDQEYWERTYGIADKGRVFEKSAVKLCPVPVTSIAAKRITHGLSVELERKIDTFCVSHSISQAVLFETAIILYLSRINSEGQAVTIGVPVLNRNSITEKRMAGMFISTMPLTISVDQAQSVLELAEHITKAHMELFRHQKYPYADILKSLREKQSFSGNLYDVMVSYQNAKTETDAETKWYSNGYSEIPLAIHIDNRDGRESHTLTVDYQTEVFGEEEAQYLIDRLECILEQVTEESSKLVRDISIVPKKEYQKIIEEFNDTAVDYPRDKCVHELFEEQVARTPESTAVVAVDRTLTYTELNNQANRVAQALIEKGIRVGDIVAFALERKSYMISIMLGILKSGAAYMPIDREYPQERIDFMLTDSKAKLFITEENIEEYMEFPNGEDARFIIDSHNPCYCIYTSGSTGKPKGTIINHQNLVNFCGNNSENQYQYYMAKNGTCTVSITQVSFDLFTFEVMLSLLNGIGIVLASENCMNNADKVAWLIRNNGVDVIHLTPSKTALFIKSEEFANALKYLKVMMIGAESFPEQLYRNLRKYTNAGIYNGYGPTETTIGASFKELKNADITIGKPIANTQIYILDRVGNPLPIGVAGELCIAGDGVGLGYLNQPELTAERFVENPFATEENGHGKIMYHTGDLARWRADGEIEYLGRIDMQVKIRGLRIELGEIESVMAGFPGIALCAVTDKKDDTGRQYLVGYYTMAGEKETPEAQDGVDEKTLRTYLSSKLPKYMVPNYFMRLDAMPMTPSGKTDRKNLPVPDLTVQETEYIAPETDAEEKLAEIWQELLKIPQVGIYDDFFDLGGDSLLAISMLSEVEAAFSVELSMRDVMENSTLEQLAFCIEQRVGESENGSRIVPCHKDRYVLLPQQKAIYAASQKNPGVLLYNMPTKIILPKFIDRNRLKDAIRVVMTHHKILRTYIVSETDEIYGVCDENMNFDFEEYAEENEKNFFRPFVLERAPLFRVGFTENAMLFDIHHIIADGETINIIMRDISAVYAGTHLEKQKLWYADYTEYYWKYDFTEHKNYFKEMLNCEFERVDLPMTTSGKEGGMSCFYKISKEVLNTVGQFVKENGLTETMVFLGVYGILLSKYTARRNVLGSVVLKNRTHMDTLEMPGMFVNTLPIHFIVEGGIKEYFEKVKDIMLNLFQYQEIPFWEIAETVGMKDKNTINTVFVYQADGEKRLMLEGESIDIEPESVRLNVSVH